MLAPHILSARAAGSPGTAASVAHHSGGAMFFAHRFQLLPLLRREGLAKIEQHVRIGLLEVGARLGHGIDLRKDLRFVGLVGFDHGMEQRFLLLEVGIEVDQLEPVLQKDVVHLVLLLIGEVQLLGEMRIVPPATEMAVVKGALHGRAAEAVLPGALPWIRSSRSAQGAVEALGESKA